jgi:hypothetical protein
MKEVVSSSTMIKILRILAIVFFIIVCFIVVIDFKNSSELLASLGILISALLASYSVMLNIENTNNNEEKKKESEKKSNIIYLFQNLNDILSVLNRYKDTDIGTFRINTHNTLLLILEKKLDKIDDKEIIKNLTDDESNYLLFIRLRLYESIGILYNYTQSIVVDNPQKFNENTEFIIEKLNLLIPLLATNNKIPIQKMENN